MSIRELRFLADESCDFAVVRALRAEGWDVLAVSKVIQLVRLPPFYLYQTRIPLFR